MPDQYDIDAVLDRQMQVESGGMASAVGKAGEIGLGQIKPDIARKYGIDPKLLYNPVVNRYVQKRYLKELLSDYHGDMHKALAAYNAGPGRIRSGYIPASTKRYVNEILGGLPTPTLRPFGATATEGRVVPTLRSFPSTPGQVIPTLRNFSAPPDHTVPTLRTGGSPLDHTIPTLRTEILPEALNLSPPHNVLEIPSRFGVSDSSRSTLEIPSRLGSDSSRSTLEIPSRFQRPLPFQPNIAQPAPNDLGQRLLGALGPASAYAEDVPPASMIPEGKYQDFSNGKTYTNKGGKVIEVPKPPPPGQPLAVRAAGWLPTAGQFIGEPLGAMAGAAIPGAGETGIPEYTGAVAGGAAGSAVGAEAENAIRKRYGLPPVSVGSETAWGAAGSAVGGALPFVGRFRKAARIAQETGKGYGEALTEEMRQEAELARKFGIGERVAQALKTAPAGQARAAYEATRAAGMRELGDQYDKILRQFYFKPLKTDFGAQALAGAPGRNLELVGKPFRQLVEEEFAKTPKTVRGAQRLLMLVRQHMRQLNPDKDGVALTALSDIQKALEQDRNEVIGPQVAAAVKNIDYYYAKQIQRFPLSRVRKAAEFPQVAEEILAHKAGDEGRILEVLDDMRKTGNIAPLQKATAARIFQKANLAQAMSPGDRLERITKAVSSIKPDIFDSLYGKGAQKTWLATAKELSERQAYLLKHPSEAAAIAAALKTYLDKPTVLAGLMGHYAQHRAVWEALGVLGGYESGHVVGAVAAVASLETYEAVAHSKWAMQALRLAATQKTPQAAARLIIAALGAGMRTASEGALGDSNAADTTR